MRDIVGVGGAPSRVKAMAGTALLFRDVDEAPDLTAVLVAVVVLLVTVSWATFQHARTRPRRPTVGPATIELGDEPPAVVDLLTDGFALTRAAVPATLVDLAARRWLAIEQYGEKVVIRLRSTPGAGQLAPFERRLLEHVRGLAIDGVVPAEVMTTGARQASASWWRGFRREVNATGQELGLCRDRWTSAMLSPLWLGALTTGTLLWIADRRSDVDADADLSEPSVAAFGITVVVLVAFVVWLVSLSRRDLQRDTDLGLTAASRWLGVREYMATIGDFEDKPAAMVALWDRYLAHAVAMDLAPQVVRELPLGAEDHHHAWSRVTGTWRPVEVHYVMVRPGYGRHPAVALASGIFFGGLAGAALVLAGRVLAGRIGIIADLPASGRSIAERVALVVGAAASVVVLWNVLRVLAALADLFTTRTIEGVVLRKRARHGWVGLTDEPARDGGDDVRTRYFVALDTGERPVVRAWIVRRQVFDEVVQGERYRVRVTPRLGYVRSAEPLAPADSGA